eukprot:12888368-Prorocentrum_lima.AAC.1
MFTKRDKPHIKLAKCWWLNFLHRQGTTLKPGQRVDQQAGKDKSIKTGFRTLGVSTNESQTIPERKKRMVNV